MHKRSAIIIIVILVGIIVVIAALVTRGMRLQSPIVFLNEPHQVVNEDTPTEAFPREGEVLELPADALEAPKAPTREELRREYARSRIVVDAECAASPLSITAVAQQTILVENNAYKKRDIVIGPRTYTIAAHGYALAAFSEKGNFTITCDDGKTRAGKVIIK